MYGELDHPNRGPFGQCKQVTLEELGLSGFHFEPSNYGCFTLARN